MERADAVVVGAGVNGLTAAVTLAEAGWKVVVLERNDEPGGAIRTEEVTLPRFRHDLFAANLNLFVGGPFFAEHGEDLARHGFEVAGAAKAFGSVFPNGRFLGVTTDGPVGLSPHDEDSFARLATQLDSVLATLGPVLSSPPSLRSALGARRYARLATSSTRAFAERFFEEREAQALVASWGMHLDFPPSARGGALFAYLETFASARFGMALGKGGARTMVDALVALLREHGGELVTNAEVTRIDGRTAHTRDAGYTATRALIANLTPRPLAQLMPTPRSWRRYRYAPGTLMIHLALDDLPHWHTSEAREYSYVHVGPYLEDMERAYAQADAGTPPDRPTLVVGQPSASDPTRAPEGKHVLWIQVRMLPRGWDGDKEAYADRVLAQLEEHAPGLRAKVLARHVMSPADLERMNPNLVGGDQLGGSHRLTQNFLLRPGPRVTEAVSVVGAGTWPGAGVGGTSGCMLARELLHSR